MKILQESVNPQTLRVIPREYASTVDLILTNEKTNSVTTFDDITATTNGAYLELTEVFDLKQDTFYSFELRTSGVTSSIQTLAANNEYLVTPAQAYLPASTDDIDIEVDYINYQENSTNTLLDFVWQGELALGSAAYVRLWLTGTPISKFLRLTVFEFGGVNFVIEYPLVNLPSSGKIEVKAVTGGLGLFLNGVEVASNLTTETIPDISDFDLYNSSLFNTAPSPSTGDVAYSKIRIGNKEWTFPEGSGSTTINNEGDITTLNTTGNVNDMWIQEGSPSQTIYKGRIFCTNQSEYSINDGKYKSNPSSNEYVIYEE